MRPSFAEVKCACLHHIINESISCRAHLRSLYFFSFVPIRLFCYNNFSSYFCYCCWVGKWNVDDNASNDMRQRYCRFQERVTSANLFDIDGIAYRRWTPNRNSLINHLKCLVTIGMMAQTTRMKIDAECIENVATSISIIRRRSIAPKKNRIE